MTISRLIILRIRYVLDKSCWENENALFMFSKFFSENRAVYGIMSKNVVEPERPQMEIWRRVACWISKPTRAKAHAHALNPHARTRAHSLCLARTRTHALRNV
jgi:hypothetical protein